MLFVLAGFGDRSLHRGDNLGDGDQKVSKENGRAFGPQFFLLTFGQHTLQELLSLFRIAISFMFPTFLKMRCNRVCPDERHGLGPFGR